MTRKSPLTACLTASLTLISLLSIAGCYGRIEERHERDVVVRPVVVEERRPVVVQERPVVIQEVRPVDRADIHVDIH